MSIIARPQRAHALNPSKYIRYNSNRQPYIFTFQRADAPITVSNLNGYFYLTTTQLDWGVLNILNIVAGDVITIVINGNPYTGKVVTLNVNNEIETDIPFVSNSVNVGFINWAKKNAYKFFIQVYAYIPSTQQTEYLGEVFGTPAKNGICKFDVRTLLEYKMEKRNKFKFNTVHQSEYSGWNYFTVKWKKTYIEDNNVINTNYIDDVELINSVETPVTYFSVDGAKQLLTTYGQNYADYYPQRVTGVNAKFLTLFDKPTYFIGYPFSLTFIYTEEGMQGFSVTREEDKFDLNGNNVGHVDANFNPSKQKLGLHQLTLNGTYGADVTNVDVWLESGAVASNFYVEEDYVADNYTLDTLNAPAPVYQITEKKNVLINTECRKNPIYLMWKNVLGGWDFWLFDKVNETNYKAKQTGTFIIENENIETGVYRERLLSSGLTKNYILGDTVKPSEADAIAQIEMSPQVYMLWNPSQLTVNPDLAWLGVNIVPKGVKYTSRESDVEIEIQIELPEFYNVAN